MSKTEVRIINEDFQMQFLRESFGKERNSNASTQRIALIWHPVRKVVDHHQLKTMTEAYFQYWLGCTPRGPILKHSDYLRSSYSPRKIVNNNKMLTCMN